VKVLDRLPAGLRLPGGFDRHRPAAVDQHAAVLELAAHLPAHASWPELVELLLAVGRTDVPLARLSEGHVDAVRILEQAGSEPVPGQVYGVWASRSRSTGLRGQASGDDWILDGTLMFASGAGVVDRALVPVWLDDEDTQLLDVAVDGWPFEESAWRTRAMELSRSHQVRLARRPVRAAVVGPENFYLDRPGFFPGGVGVAAVWAGGAARVTDLVERGLAAAPPPAQVARLGEMRTDVVAAASVARGTARCLSTTPTDELRTTCTLARASVAAGVRRVLAHARVVAGAAGLALDEDLTRAIDDLSLFTAQQSVDGDAGWLGGLP
jgi:hypothetical protein